MFFRLREMPSEVNFIAGRMVRINAQSEKQDIVNTVNRMDKFVSIPFKRKKRKAH